MRSRLFHRFTNSAWCLFFFLPHKFQVYQDSDVDIWTFGTPLITISLFTILLHLSIEIKSWVSAKLCSSHRSSDLFARRLIWRRLRPLLSLFHKSDLLDWFSQSGRAVWNVGRAWSSTLAYFCLHRSDSRYAENPLGFRICSCHDLYILTLFKCYFPLAS